MQQIGMILAGGKSSRMGKDKADLPWRQFTLLTHMQQCLQASLCEQVVISRNHSGGIADRFVNKGPLGGIDAVLQALPTRCLLTIVPVDMPLLNSASLIKLQTYSAKNQQSVFYSSSFLPCVLKVDNSLRDYIELQLREAEDYSVKSILRFSNAEDIAHPDPHMLSNTNTPKQWNELFQANNID